MSAAEAKRVTAAMAAAIEYIERGSNSALARIVATELRGAIALVGGRGDL